MRRRSGEIATATAILIAVGVALVAFLYPKINPFNGAADLANRRSASATSTEEIIRLSKSAPEHEVVIERRSATSDEVTDPKLTVGQRIGRFFAGVGTWGLVFICVSLLFFSGAPIIWAVRKYAVMKQAFKNTVAAIRETDEDTFAKLKPNLEAKHDRRDRQMVDKIKSELQ